MKNWPLVALAIVGTGVVAQPAQAQRLQAGLEVGYAHDLALFVGGRVQMQVGHLITDDPEAILNGVVVGLVLDYYVDPYSDGLSGELDGSAIVLTANGVVPLASEGGFTPYAGAGVHLARYSAAYLNDSFVGSGFGLNAVGGAQFQVFRFPAFAEATMNLGGARQFALALGILFGGGS